MRSSSYLANNVWLHKMAKSTSFQNKRFLLRKNRCSSIKKTMNHPFRFLLSTSLFLQQTIRCTLLGKFSNSKSLLLTFFRGTLKITSTSCSHPEAGVMFHFDTALSIMRLKHHKFGMKNSHENLLKRKSKKPKFPSLISVKPSVYSGMVFCRRVTRLVLSLIVLGSLVGFFIWVH